MGDLRMEHFPVLETERLTLREIRESDAAAVFAIFGDEQVTRYYDVTTMTTMAQARQMAARLRERNDKGDTLRWGVVRKSDHQFIGTGGFNHFMRGWAVAGIGYDIASAYWNHGYMTEALRAILRYGFETLHLNRVEAHVMPANDASARVLEKLGFQREGLLREYGFWKNQYWDLQLFALLQREWRSQV